MPKIIQLTPLQSPYTIILLSVVTFYLLAGNGTDVFNANLSNNIGKAVLHSIVYFCYLLILFYAVNLNRFIFAITTPILFLISTAAAYFITELGIKINPSVIAAVMTTNTGEASEIISFELVLRLSMACSMGGFLVYLRFQQKPITVKSKTVSQRRLSIIMISATILSSTLLLRLYFVPLTYLFQPFSLTVSTIPSTPDVVLDLAQQLWPQHPIINIQKNKKKGRIRFDVKPTGTHERLRLYASKGDFSIKNNYIERRYNKNGNHLKTRLRFASTVESYFPKHFAPFNHITALWSYANHRIAQTQAAATLNDISQYPSTLDTQLADNLIVVVILGESARADHFAINGYARATNPRLSQRTDVINYRNVYSCAASTTVAIPCLLTRLRGETLPDAYTSSTVKTYLYQPIATENSFISLFKKHGFNTAWLSLNQVWGRKNEPISMMVADAQTRTFLSDISVSYASARDEQLLPLLKTHLAKHQQNSLIVLHTRGSHWAYRARYPKSFEHFKPICKKSLPSKCEPQQLINTYDNTILYTDNFIAQVITLLENHNALLVYTSDHGESLGEAGVYTHSVMSRKEQRWVPMIWWASAQYQNDNADYYRALQHHTKQTISHDYLFHSVLHCAGIQSPVIDHSLSLCHDNDFIITMD